MYFDMKVGSYGGNRNSLQLRLVAEVNRNNTFTLRLVAAGNRNSLQLRLVAGGSRNSVLLH